MRPSARVIAFAAARDDCADCRIANECLAEAVDAGPGRPEVHSGPRVVHRGDHLFRAGERFESLFIVRCGAVKIYTLSPGGEEQVIAFHGPGDLVGVDGIETAEHVTSAVALDTTSVCALPFEAVCRASARSATVLRRLLAKMSARVRRDEARLQMLGHKSADQRVAAFVLAQSRRRAELGFAADEINLPMPRGDIASFLALAVETVSRVLTRLQEAGVLHVQRNRLRIDDRDHLAVIAEAPAEPAVRARAPG